MTIRAVAVACGILMAGTAAAADVTAVSGLSMRRNNTTGVVECFRGCIVKFTSANTLNIESGRMTANQRAGLSEYESARFVVGDQEYVAEKASLQLGTDGTAELRTDYLRITTLVK